MLLVSARLGIGIECCEIVLILFLLLLYFHSNIPSVYTFIAFWVQEALLSKILTPIVEASPPLLIYR
jgi:hypothetical protein